MGWLSVAAVLVACDKGASPPRLFTEDELAALEARAHALPAYEMPNYATLGSFPDIDSLAKAEPTYAVVELGRLVSTDGAVNVVRRTSDTWLRLERITSNLLMQLRRAQLTPAQLDQLAFDLDAALATEPPIANDLLAQTNRSRAMIVAPTKLSGINPLSSDELGMYLAAEDTIDQMIAQSCVGTLSACHAALKPSSPPFIDAKALLVEHEAEIQALHSSDQRLALQSKLVTRLARSELTLYGLIFANRAMATTELVALRIEVESRRTGRCDPAMFDAPPRLGERLTVETHDGTVEVWPPTWAAFAAPRSPIKIACP